MSQPAHRPCLILALLVLAKLAWAQAESRGGAPEARQSPPGGPAQPGQQWDANLFGDMGGVRSALAERGLTFGLQETSEVLGNVSGGVRRTAVYEGLTQFGLGIDLKAIGLEGGTFNVTGYQIHGRGLSLNALGNNLNTVSGIEAERGTLLFELWYEQVLAGGAVAVRVGQMAADQEFVLSKYASLFLNHTFGWSSLPSADLPSGGPNFPLATPGIRLRLTPREGLTFLGAVFNGDPAGRGPGTPQQRNPSGTAFRLNDGVFAIAEAQVSQEFGGLPGTYKIGGWYNSENFRDLRRNAAGQSLADPLATDPLGVRRRGNWGLYGLADQMVWRPPGTTDVGIGLFVRAMGAPGDRNLINFYLDAGVTYKGPFPIRPSDTAGIGVAYARYSDTVRDLDRDLGQFSGSKHRIRRNESVIEATYQAQIMPWWQVQPSAQYVVNLNGNGIDPNNPGKRLGNAFVLILRTNLSF